MIMNWRSCIWRSTIRDLYLFESKSHLSDEPELNSEKTLPDLSSIVRWMIIQASAPKSCAVGECLGQVGTQCFNIEAAHELISNSTAIFRTSNALPWTSTHQALQRLPIDGLAECPFQLQILFSDIWRSWQDNSRSMMDRGWNLI